MPIGFFNQLKTVFAQTGERHKLPPGGASRLSFDDRLLRAAAIMGGDFKTAASIGRGTGQSDGLDQAASILGRDAGDQNPLGGLAMPPHLGGLAMPPHTDRAIDDQALRQENFSDLRRQAFRISRGDVVSQLFPGYRDI